ncbi:hypothetical protein CJ301_00325 [Limimaricola cinnabarinus]|uniref:Uncharacterized protein n=1 Tax=Limimaricola cinnabarinus TaxID=1125964 RepID=A0A2G1MLG7_9RHOB|nr:hypothetical protein CJ301_00325 [Limimaricola cinnabarinus]
MFVMHVVRPGCATDRFLKTIQQIADESDIDRAEDRPGIDFSYQAESVSSTFRREVIAVRGLR